MRRRSLVLCAFIATLAFSRGVPAHHSIVGQFDLSRRVTLRGTISKVDWINPHPYVHLQVADGRGAVTTWALSMAPVAMLRKAGITREALAGKPGELVTVTALPALNGKPMAWITRITYADGHYYSMSE